jgi:hypothetical protein
MDANSEVLQAAAQATYGLDLNGALRAATGLRLDANGICRKLWGKEFNEAFDEMLAMVSSHGLVLPGTSGAYASTPDVAALDITGDIDLRAEFVRTRAGSEALIGKYGASPNKSYRLRALTFAPAAAVMEWSVTGAADLNVPVATVVNPGAYRATLAVATGTVTVYTATSMDGPWTQAGQSVGGATSIFSGAAPLEVGASEGGTALTFRGRITRAEVRSGIDGTVVANPDFRNLAPGTTSFADGTGKTWTIHGAAEVV